jgi:hypothetical protein
MMTSEGETGISFLDLHDEYLIEIPIPTILVSSVDLLIYLK